MEHRHDKTRSNQIRYIGARLTRTAGAAGRAGESGAGGALRGLPKVEELSLLLSPTPRREAAALFFSVAMLRKGAIMLVALEHAGSINFSRVGR